MEGFIYNQTKIPKTQWRYGFRTSAATGCGWIATYNALRLLGRKEEPETLIHYYQTRLPLINGNFGTFFLNPVLFFKRQGFRVRVTARRSEFDELVKGSDACILHYWWHHKYKLGTHYAAVGNRNGKMVGYNTFRNSTGPDDYGMSLECFLKKQKFFWPVLIAIWDDDKENRNRLQRERDLSCSEKCPE